MRALVQGGWCDGFMDPHRSPDEHRIEVWGMCNVEALSDIYFVRRRSLWILWNYIRDIGLLNVWRKIRSRGRERYRNQKFVSVGFGCVVETSDHEVLPVGQNVIFVAPCHPACVERIVLPRQLVRPVEAGRWPGSNVESVLHMAKRPPESMRARWWSRVRGWNSNSGIVLGDTGALLDAAAECVRSLDWSSAVPLPVAGKSDVAETRRVVRADATDDRPSATLIGYGNYAKSVILPNIAGSLRLDRIHEIDPTQIPRNERSVDWDTAAGPRQHDPYDVLLVAGYHHTHAPLAVEALQRGRYAVVEKPLVVDRAQLDGLVEAVRAVPKLFACFHKRYLPFNALAQSDLGVQPGDAISYHCIVYEVPLPELHWYRWPNSRSRLVSNGCHWVDHFLFLNHFAPPVRQHVSMAGDGTINCSVELENGAFFTMVLTDRGSSRIGVQDYIELRANDVTVKMINGSRYTAESSHRLLRRRRVNKMRSYSEMYRAIGRKIAAGERGDSLRSIETSSSLILSLEEQLVDQVGRGDESKAAVVR